MNTTDHPRAVACIRFVRRLLGLERMPEPDHRRRVIIADCGPDDGKLGTVYATYPPDYSTVMIDGLTRLQAFREGELRDAPNGKNQAREPSVPNTTQTP